MVCTPLPSVMFLQALLSASSSVRLLQRNCGCPYTFCRCHSLTHCTILLQEDAHSILLDLDNIKSGFFGVFDGHGGKEVAKFSALYLVSLLAMHFRQGHPLREAIALLALHAAASALGASSKQVAGTSQLLMEPSPPRCSHWASILMQHLDSRARSF